MKQFTESLLGNPDDLMKSTDQAVDDTMFIKISNNAPKYYRPHCDCMGRPLKVGDWVISCTSILNRTNMRLCRVTGLQSKNIKLEWFGYRDTVDKNDPPQVWNISVPGSSVFLIEDHTKFLKMIK